MTPDRAGYRDSSNLYIFGKGDPVNNSDPTGMVVGLRGSSAEKSAAYQRLLRVLDNPTAAAHFRVTDKFRVELDIPVNEFTDAYGGRAAQLAQMIDSDKVIYLTELMGDLPHNTPSDNVFAARTMEGLLNQAGGGIFYTDDDNKHGYAAFDARLFPRRLADVQETRDAVFVHEFFGHGYDWAVPLSWPEEQTGKIRPQYLGNPPWTSGVRAGEAAGLTAEDIYRLEHGMKLRTYYKAAKDDWQWPASLSPYIAAQKKKAADAAEAKRREAAGRRREFLLDRMY